MGLDVLITGADGGIGLEYANQMLARGDRVFAACRNPGQCSGLQELGKKYGGKLHAVWMDVTIEDTIERSARQIERVTDKLDIIINNAAEPVDRTERIDNLSQEVLLRSFNVNAVGPFMVIKHCLGLLRKSPVRKIANMSSESGSIQGMDAFRNFYAYGASKAAQNMLTRILSFELKPDNVIIVALHPGWVHTKDVNSMAPTKPPEAVAALLSVIDRATMKDSGKFLTYQYEEMPW